MRVFYRFTGILDERSASLPINCSSRNIPSGTKCRTKHKDDMVNARLVPSILPTYIPPLSGVINKDSMPRDFEYTLVTAYLPKWVCAVHTDQDKIAALKFSDFNQGDHKVYNTLAP
jgi:hypothetical protein